MKRNEIHDIIRAYFDARTTDGKEYDDNHKIVVNILKQYPAYANYYLTEEERNTEE